MRSPFESVSIDGQWNWAREHNGRPLMGDASQNEFKTSVAFDEDKNKYLTSDIDQTLFQSRFTGPNAIPLHDVSYDPVVPIPTHVRDGSIVRAHFRLKGARSGDRVGRGEPDNETHEGVIQELLDALNAADSQITFTTTVFGDENAHLEIWRCPKGSTYQWVREPETRQWFERKKYIQPDLCGFDVSRRSAGPNNKSIVVEVIRTHEPELETWGRLVELSQTNHLVMFYFCHPERTGNWLGRMDAAHPQTNQPLRLRTELYLLDGVFYKQGKVFRSALSGDALRVEILKELKRIKNL
jgi:hypothetical protein